MVESYGTIALVGSGEYLEPMLQIEQGLLDAGVACGKSRKYAQLATAAGQEGGDRLTYWETLGAAQAERLNVEQVFVPAFDRDSANDPDLAAMLEDVALIYLSGGDPKYAAESLHDTAVGNAITAAWKSGSSVAGCSAGAMALGPDVAHIRGLPHHRVNGLAIVPHLEVIPHYDRLLGRLPESAVHFLLANERDVFVVGIDENTALVSIGGHDWQVHGFGKVHVLRGGPAASYADGSSLTLSL